MSPPSSGAENMAVDEVLLARARDTGESVLRVYTWSQPTLSLGRNQTARGLYDVAEARQRGIDIVRRPTGGRAVLHHREITYSVTAPAPGSLRESYSAINALLLHALRALGVDARIAQPTERASSPGVSPCFETPSEGELIVNGRKLVGSAQWREEGALLQHGSILIDDDQSLIAALLSVAVAPTPAPATLRETIGRSPSVEEVADALVNAVRALEDEDADPLLVDDALQSRVRDAAPRFASDEWTWRR